MAHRATPFYSILGKATWSQGYLNRLPDAAFLLIEPGGSLDATGRTTPRSLRHLPIRDADGALDLPHLRNALAQIPKAGPWLADGDRDALRDKAQKLLDRAVATTHKAAAGVPDWALPYLTHLDRHELLSLSREIAHKAWTGDTAIAKRGADWLASFSAPAPAPPPPPAPPALDEVLASVERTYRAALGIEKASARPKLAATTEACLREKVAIHNAARGADPTRKATLAQLRKAFLRGTDARRSAAGRPMVKSRIQWGLGRVNAFLSLLGKGAPTRAAYTADNDLLPAGHPKSSKPARAPTQKDELGLGDLAAGGLLAPEQGLPLRRFRQIPILLDRPKGFVQTGVGKDGLPWRREYTADYGYIPATAGGDEEELDVFLGDNPDAANAYVVVQRDDTGAFDELKVFLGYDSAEAARAVYVAHIPERFLASMAEVPVALFEALLGLEPAEAAKSAEKAAEPASPADVAKGDSKHTIVVETTADGLAAIAQILRLLQRTGDVGHGCQIAYEDGGYLYSVAYFDGDGGAKLTSITIDGKEVLADPAEYPWNNKTIQPIGDMLSPAKLEALAQRSAAKAADVDSSVALQKAERPLLHGTRQAIAMGYLALDAEGAVVLGPRSLRTEEESAAIEKGDLAFTQIGKAATAAEPAEERYVLGPVLIPDVADLQGDVLSTEEIRQTAFAWMTTYQNMGVQHGADAEKIVGFRQEAPGLVSGTGFALVESYVVTEDRGYAEINARKMPSGTWMLGAKVVDDALWAKVKAGQITGWSIGGFGKRSPLAA